MASGYWGPITATLDWCEANYQFSHYIAEMANALSNLYSIGLAVWGILAARDAKLPRTYLLGYIGFALVGIGSFAFHSSLLFEAQLADELPMIYLSAHGLAVLFDTKPGYGLNSRTITILTVELVFDILFSWSYVSLYRNPVYHQVVFAMIVLSTISRVAYLLHWSLESISTQVRHDTRYCFTLGPVVFALGFLVWNLDNIFCGALTGWKRSVGWPAAFLLEGHSWWHVLTGYGSYFMITGIIYLSLCVKDDPRDYTLDYKYGMPFVRRIKGKKLE